MHAAVWTLGLSLAATSLLAQDASDMLERDLAGQRVEVLLDLPGDDSGVDVHPGDAQEVDYREHGNRLHRYGISLRKGDEATITRVRVRKDRIEVHLNGGGFSSSDATTIPSAYVSKSSREKELEKQVKSQTDPVRRRAAQEELDDLRADRQRDQRRLEAEAATLRELAKSREIDLRRESGSRINIRWESAVPEEALTREGLMAELEPYLRYAGTGEPESAATYADETQLTVLRKGMTRAGVERLAGSADECQKEDLGGLRVEACTYSPEGLRVTARYAEGVLIRFLIESE